MPPLKLNVRSTRLENLLVRDLMTLNPISIRHGMSVRDAAQSLDKRGIGAAPVVNDAGHAIGVLSSTDVLKAVSAGADRAPVEEFMTPAVIAVQTEADALQAFTIMVRCAIGRVFVADEHGTHVGVVSTSDVLRALTARWSEHDVSTSAAFEERDQRSEFHTKTESTS